MSKFVERCFYYFIVWQRKRLIDRYEKKINKYESKLSTSKYMYEWLLKDTKELLEKVHICKKCKSETVSITRV